MALKFRLKGLAETFVDSIVCPCCGERGNDDRSFSTDNTKVTYDGIVIVVQCRRCKEIFVPESQRLGIINPPLLKEAVEQDSVETGEAVMPNIEAVKLNIELLNVMRKYELN